MSRSPPTSPATTHRPLAIASTATRPNGSATDGTSTTSCAAMRAGTSAGSRSRSHGPTSVSASRWRPRSPCASSGRRDRGRAAPPAAASARSATGPRRAGPPAAGRRARRRWPAVSSEFVSSRSRAPCHPLREPAHRRGEVAPVAHVAAVRVDDQRHAAHPGNDQPDEAGRDEHVRLDPVGSPARRGWHRAAGSGRSSGSGAAASAAARRAARRPRSPARGRTCLRSAARGSARCA